LDYWCARRGVPHPSIDFDADIGYDSAGEIREYFILDWKDPDSYQQAFKRLLRTRFDLGHFFRRCAARSSICSRPGSQSAWCG
jgi:hypothetical protein